MNERQINGLIEKVKDGRLSRRNFVQRMLAIGLSVPTAGMILSHRGVAWAQSGFTYKPTKAGGGGPLKLLFWQAPTLLNPHFAVGTKDQRWGVPATGQRYLESGVRSAQNAEDRSAELRIGVPKLLSQNRIQILQHRDGVLVVHRCRAQRVPRQRRHSGRRCTFATDVAEKESPAVVGQRKQVVEVAAHLVAGRCPVVRRRGHPRRR